MRYACTLPALVLFFSHAAIATAQPKDSRLGPAKTLNAYFPFDPPQTRQDWNTRRDRVRAQVLIGNGLWPMPAKAPLKATVHGKIDRDEYTIEKVFFASYPGFYVTGNLYRPKSKTPDGGYPAVLCPHGHWNNGRFYDAGEARAKTDIASGAEKTVAGARYPLQARCAQLARMGCVVFIYDMVGYADSQQIKHRVGFTDPEAELRLQSFMGLQTFNSICALDFLSSLPEVDAKRIGVTGASGGGTQTFLLCGIDERPAAAFPAVMVSTAMQGGCVCENCSYLRVGTGNIELAGLFAPKPLGMSGAKDWTIDIETKGLPQLQALYKLLGAPDNVMAKCFPQFGHNYNQVSREVMYNFFNKHLKLGQMGTVEEQPFVPVPPAELSVFDDQHPLPKDAVDAYELRRRMTVEANQQREKLLPGDAKSLLTFQHAIGTPLQVMLDAEPLTKATAIERSNEAQLEKGSSGVLGTRFALSRKGAGEAIPALLVRNKDFDGRLVVWIHPDGNSSLMKDGKLVAAAQQIIDKKGGILAVDVFMTGAYGQVKREPVNPNYAGFTFGYNRPLLANRVRDIITAVASARVAPDVKAVHLVGFGKAGTWTALARPLCGDLVARTAADLDQFRFETILSNQDEMMLPGALKYGGLPVLSALSAPHELYLHNTRGTGDDRWRRAAYQAAGGAGKLVQHEDRSADEAVVNWLLQ